ncbi:MAG: DUF29 domain-containing protein [Gammaproteobacteria bacterium]|nr:MAG: DUF29 domain-containing protein [Gammaproteobacteria bacterium]RKZ43905.1 MAG: DUF29 domain-containing protein [Gammaproteobacteria bacterium]RKZ75678.1 MAG: DUF29 domain-containing protein [Gammaproteobacteria bacterium]
MHQSTVEYNQDFYGWINHHVALLRNGRLSEIDIENLIDELESMGKRDRRELESHFRILLAHLLKWQYQPTHRSRSWRASIIEQRLQITKQLKDSPSLKNYLSESKDEAYPDAVKISKTETGLDKSLFPTTCSYFLEDILDKEFYPD